MKKLIAALSILCLTNIAALQARPIEKESPFTNSELLSLSKQQIPSFAAVKEVESGFLRTASGTSISPSTQPFSTMETSRGAD